MRFTMFDDSAANAPLDIGEVVSRTGVPTTTLHLWERKGLITPTGRVGLRRQYRVGVLDTIAIIVLLQRSRFTLAEIGDLLADGAFVDGKGLLVDKLAALTQLQADVEVAIDGLQHALDCPKPGPFECTGFRAHLVGVLPVDRSNERENE